MRFTIEDVETRFPVLDYREEPDADTRDASPEYRTPRERYEAAEPGIYRNVPEAAYHAHPSWSRSGLWVLARKTPRHLQHKKSLQDQPPDPPKLGAAMTIGSATHCMLLRPDDFDAEWGVLPDEYKGYSKADKEALAQLRDRVGPENVLRPQDRDLAQAMLGAVAEHELAGDLCAHLPGESELTLLWDEAVILGDDTEVRIPMRARLDRYVLPTPERYGVVVDLKTTADASTSKMARSAGDFGYVFQEAVYRRGCLAVGLPVSFYLCVGVERGEPHVVNVVDHDPTDVGDHGELAVRLLRLLALCVHSDHWPGYVEAAPNLVSLPGFARPDALPVSPA